jgi:arylformamidase
MRWTGSGPKWPPHGATDGRSGPGRRGIRYGHVPRTRFDLFLPGRARQGPRRLRPRRLLAVDGQIRLLPPRRGRAPHGWAVAMPSYPQAPEARISRSRGRRHGHRRGGRARSRAPSALPGIRRAGISSRAWPATAPPARPGRDAGSNGCSRSAASMTCAPAAPVGDERGPERSTRSEAAAESPALLDPRPTLSFHAVVGAAERPELMRQTRLLAEAWGRKGADISDAYIV